MQLSVAVRCLWAKKDRNGELAWLPLVTHLTDTASVAQKLWNHWLSKGVQDALAIAVGDVETAEALLVFLACIHDLGKATPVFQAKPTDSFVAGELDERMAERLVTCGLPMKPYSAFHDPRYTPHALATELLLRQAGCNRCIASILGAHHGKPADSHALVYYGPETLAENYHLGHEGKAAWTSVQRELIAFALERAGFPSLEALPWPPLSAQVLYCGLIILADWIASNESHFPYFPIDDDLSVYPPDRASKGWDSFSLPNPWTPDNMWQTEDLYTLRFHLRHPHPMQEAVAQWARGVSHPSIAVLEAPMGCGKTEAALVMAEIFAEKTGRSGVFFALPTQATSNAMFERLRRWTAALELNGAGSIRLAHGKAQINQDYHRLFEGGKNVGTDEEESAQPYMWFEGNRKALLADFVVGTIDQLLLAALRQKYVMLRHLGLANKVVIIDECHAYDAYMSRYLQKALRWLGAYGVPVIVLSATLTGKQRKMVIEAYRGKPAVPSAPFNPLVPKSALPPDVSQKWVTSRDYPLLTYTDGDRTDYLPIDDRADTLEIVVERIGDDALLARLDTLLAEGGYAGIIVNTVKRAQETARLLKAHFGEEAVTLLHSRFLAPDRAFKEKDLLEKVGDKSDSRVRADRYIVVGSQVMEQSLDIDFDLLVSDLCPMDFLLQRIGRLHRHKRARPSALRQARCLVLGAQDDCLDDGAKAVYGEYLLMRTRAFLPDRIVLPADIPTLVESAYDGNMAIHPEPAGYAQAKANAEKKINDKEQKADVFRISDPLRNADDTLTDWLDISVDASEKGGQAAVRDGDESFEVLALWQGGDRVPRFLPWIENGRTVPIGAMPDSETARLLACQSLRLPHELCYPWVIEKTIQTLEHDNMALNRWQESPWLKGELFLLLDENLSMILNGYHLIYDREIGLTCEKEDTTHAG